MKNFKYLYIPEGMPDSDGVVGTSGVSSEESAGELPGEVAEVVGPLAAVPPSNKSFTFKA